MLEEVRDNRQFNFRFEQWGNIRDRPFAWSRDAALRVSE
jgi:hypothetical protein